VHSLGKRLRALRKEQGLTLAKLGQQVGLSASYLSQIERGVTMPSLARLATIASALDVEVRHFFEEDVSDPCVIRLNQGKRLGSTADVLVELLSADPTDKKIQPHRLVYQPGASWDQLPTRSGEEFGFVLKGQLMVTVGEETFVLEAGDSIHYQTLQAHSWQNEGDEECIVVWAVSPPISEVELGGQAAYEERR
jgi:transcriptional regulator with XRE-family HTH domain